VEQPRTEKLYPRGYSEFEKRDYSVEFTITKYRELSFNNLTGPIPQKINNMNRLVSLTLTDNKCNGTIPSMNGTSLTLLYASGNNFSGPIPTHLASVRNLVVL